MSQPRILIVEDDPDGLRSMTDAIEDMGFVAVAAETGEEGVRLFREGGIDAVLSDLVLPAMDGVEVLTRIRQADPRMPVLIMTAYGSVDSSVKAMKAGAYDYVTKPLDLDDIQSKVARAVETSRLRREVVDLRRSIHDRDSASQMVAVSASMREVVRQVESLADTNVTVLILGESGVGKEVVARALHVDGRRAVGPFVAVNGGAFVETLLESELFGHEKGAFTGAVGQRKGAFERADGGTLFLDEIGEAPPSVQVKLLRVLEDRELLRVGGQVSFRVDVRLVSASNKDLDALVAEGTFREDLLYRLNVVSIRVPPLRERPEDIRPLTDRFIAAACEAHGRHIQSVSKDYYERLMQHPWPGNVRQLRNVIETSVVLAKEPALTAASIRLDEASITAGGAWAVPEGMTLEQLECEILAQALRRYQGNRTLTADKLGISRRTIQRKIKEHGLPF